MVHRPSVRATLIAIVVGASLTIGLLPLSVAGHEPPDIDPFLYGLGQTESSGRYDAENASSGAFGKYQIMPYNWGPWAARYIGDDDAPQTPKNQERVARAKVTALYNWLSSWRMVAHWWLTGSSDRNENRWSAYSLRYVNKVMRIYGEAGGGAPTTATIQNTAISVVYEGSWASARHGRYSGGTVSYATTAGASATLRFTGTKVVWYGPTGPTRGKAKVIVDGKLVRTVDLGTKRFSSRVALFSKSWTTAGKHTVRIEVVGTPGRKLVAIDSFSVRN